MLALVHNGSIVEVFVDADHASRTLEKYPADGKVIEVVEAPLAIGSHQEVCSWSLTIEGDVVQRVWTTAEKKVTTADVEIERDRRLQLGFDYDFGDARGVHHIGTTDADMIGWSEVSTYAGALIDAGDITTPIEISTNTGSCQVTAPEWRVIEIAAAEFRQPLWSASFRLAKMSPIPAGYQDDSYWT